MGSIVIKLSPSKLENPDLDLRYLIPGKIEEFTNREVTDDGYDYLDDKENSMLIFLQSKNPEEDVIKVLDILRRVNFLRNNIFEAGIVAINKGDGYEVIHPDRHDEDFIV